ncbi:MAG: hypothetical protein GY708_29190, partial [Actinomycetia bacterium]|nr:hypothetical protein [Actinomycetes bacterium]
DPDDLHQHYNAYEPTGAPKAAQVELPAPGTYTFKILEFTVSAGPCGTCEAGFSGSSVEVEVDDGDVVGISKGEPTWMS